MPIYEYECKEGHQFEELQKISDAPLTACKQCGQPVRKLVSQTAFALKGSGWYQDGYASNPTATAKTEAKTPATDSKPSTKESKPTKQKGDQS